MGWKGVVRSTGAAARAAERDSKRRQRELAQREKHYQKMQVLEQAAYEVDVFNNHLDLICSIHKDCSEGFDWAATVALPEPPKPTRSNSNELSACRDRDRYSPNFIDRIFKSEPKKRARLELAVAKAIDKDEAAFQARLKSWGHDFKVWRESVEIGNAVLAGNAKARLKVIEEENSFAEISGLGSNISLHADDGKPVRATIRVHGSDIIPKEVKSLLQSGKLSVKQMPLGKFHELHQDYVCGVVLRVARELFAVLPDGMVGTVLIFV